MSTQITYIGHSTVLLQSGSVSVLTDPVLSHRLFWLKRHRPLPFPAEDFPEPGAILVSHAHYDHLDLPSFKYFSSKVPIILPKGLAPLVAKVVKNPLIELAYGEEHDFGVLGGLNIRAIPVTHSGFRLSGLTYRACNGYLIEMSGNRIFFPGDTAYRSDFKQLIQGEGPEKKIDVALLPIGPCKPDWLMRRNHLNPADALRVFEDIQAQTMIPIHWGTFRLALDPVSEPLEDLKRLVEAKGLSTRVRCLPSGESFLV